MHIHVRILGTYMGRIEHLSYVVLLGIAASLCSNILLVC